MKLQALAFILIFVSISSCTPVIQLPTAPEAATSQTAIATAAATRVLPQATTSGTPTRVHQAPGATASVKGSCSPFHAPGCVLSFTAVPTEVVTGGSITFTWLVTGTNIVGLGQHNYYAVASGLGFQSWANLPANGSLTIKMDGVGPKVYRFRLWADNPVAGASKIVEVHYGCAGSFFFAPLQPPIGSDCPGPAVSTPLTQQAFEHGFMIWPQSGNTIYILYDPDVGYPAVVAFYGEEIGNPENDSNETPPPGKLQPLNMLGKVWQKYGLLNRLGWALAPEQTFVSTVQRNFLNPVYLRAADGRVIYIIVDSNAYDRMASPRWGYLSP